MEPHLDKEEVQRWLAGQRETQKVIERERTRALLDLTPEKAWEMYLSLIDGELPGQRDLTKPSFLLAATRRVFDLQAR